MLQVFAFAEVRCKKIIGNLGNLELVLKPLGRSEQSEQSEICAICLDAGPGFRKLQCILPADHRGTVTEIEEMNE